MGKLARNAAMAVLCVAAGAPLGCGRTEDTSAGPGIQDGSSGAGGGASETGGTSGTAGAASPSLDAMAPSTATPEASVEGPDAADVGTQTEAGAVQDASLAGVDAGGGGAPTDAGAVQASVDASVPDAAGAPADASASEAGVTDAGGGCVATCSLPHAVSTCAGGTCAIAVCHAYYADCDGDPSNGCEAALNADPANCGGCWMSCGSCGCIYGMCEACACIPPLAACDGIAANGCETNLSTSAAHCGLCGNACGEGEACVGGQCLLAVGTPCVSNADCAALPGSEPVCCNQICRLDCDPGFWDCDGDPTNGCETNYWTDPDNCGTCGAACLPSEVCRSGVCRLAVCTPPFANCGGEVGCNTNTDTDPSNCGGCGVVCPPGAATCAGGTCFIACGYPSADCNGLAGDGCEANAWDCPLTCPVGFGNCDGVLANGCEADLQHDEDNCGMCGNFCLPISACPTWHASCVSGTCGVNDCYPGLGDCDGSSATGCETVITNNPNNCGGCGMACAPPPGAVHVTSACFGCECQIDCEGGWDDCDGDPANGCETRLCGRGCLAPLVP